MKKLFLRRSEKAVIFSAAEVVEASDTYQPMPEGSEQPEIVPLSQGSELDTYQGTDRATGDRVYFKSLKKLERWLQPMNLSKWLIVVGGMLLIAGLLTAFISSHYTSRVMGEARKGVAVLAPDKGDPAWKKKENLLWWADFWFYVGLVLTAIGVILQTLGSVLPAEERLTNNQRPVSAEPDSLANTREIRFEDD